MLWVRGGRLGPGTSVPLALALALALALVLALALALALALLLRLCLHLLSPLQQVPELLQADPPVPGLVAGPEDAVGLGLVHVLHHLRRKREELG